MGCPICLGYIERLNEAVTQHWAFLLTSEDDFSDLKEIAKQVPAPFRPLLEERAKAALHAIIFRLLGRILLASEMKDSATWLMDAPDDLEPVATMAVLERLRDRAIAWRISLGIELEGSGVAALRMKFIEDVWNALLITDNLLADMTQGNFSGAGAALAGVMILARSEQLEWLPTLETLLEKWR